MKTGEKNVCSINNIIAGSKVFLESFLPFICKNLRRKVYFSSLAKGALPNYFCRS